MKAIIPVGGLGTRFLPATKAIPKELLPIIDKPVIQYIVEEAVASGIEDIIFVVNPWKKALIKKHFERDLNLEKRLHGKPDLLKRIQSINGLARFSYAIQHEPLGDGHAILCARHLLGKEPFAVLFGDDIIDSSTPALAQLLKVHKKTRSSIICLEKVPKSETHKYGIIKPGSINGNVYEIKGLIEKPIPSRAPSNLGIIGKYVVTQGILESLSRIRKNGEIRLIDGFRASNEPLYGVEVKGERFDTGSKEGFIQAIKHYSAQFYPSKSPHKNHAI